ncbi:cellulose binding domain-containing protein [Sanguibacter sp. 26GB23]|uniref:cellulose binding domain-containing protein n=1 Tax=Sanguibacter sp. 26GB23 TaxID=3156066 RepID=UPI0032AF18F7
MRVLSAVVPIATFSLLACGVGVASATQPGSATTGSTTTTTGTAAASTAYDWGNVEIVGGGFVPAIIFNQSEPGLVYARTDIGGAYRLDPTTQRWVPLLDHVGWTDWSYSGVLSLATDPVDPDRVYVAAGTYTNSWDPNNGAILRSDDRGATWERTVLPFKVGGNMPGRGMGERLQIDPNDNAVLYYGAESGNGLWRSTDHGGTWAQVTTFPNAGNYVQDPSYDYTADNQGVTWVTFDPTTGATGQTTQTIYVGVADQDNPVYRSTDGGATWESVPGQPTGYLAHKGVIDHEGQQLYIATSDTGGPYDGAKGDVWRLDLTTDAWTQVSPVPSSSTDAGWGYSGLTIDRADPDTIMVTTQVAWWPDINIFRSTDRGETWTQIWEFAAYPERTQRYTQDISGAPWLTFGNEPAPPETSPKLGWMAESFEIDPFDSDRFYYGTGATVYGGTNLTDWDDGGTVDISVKAQGIEETAVLDLIAPPGAVELVSGLGDIGGFVHPDITEVPDAMYTQPYHGTVTSLDYAGLAPSTIVRVGQAVDGTVESHIGISTTGGSSWWAGQQPAGVTAAGTVAVGARVEADRVSPTTFYGYSAGTFYVSTDGGATFTASAAAGLPATGNVRFAAVPGEQGDVWLAGGTTTGAYGMWRSTDSGATFTRVDGVEEGDSIGFGKAAPGASYPAVYTSSKIDGVRGIFRSDDAGTTWVRINDDQHQWAWTGSTITGDPDVYGRVYVGTNGRGIVVGDPDVDGTDPTDPPTDPTDPTDPPTDPTPDTAPPSAPAGLTAGTPTATSVPLAWTASTDDVAVTGYDVYQGAVKIGSSPTTSYTVTGLTADTEYSFTVRAKDRAGNVSTPSAALTTRTATAPTTPVGSCTVAYSTNAWSTGFTGSLTMTNTSAAPLTSWNLAFAFPAGQTVTQGWSAIFTQTGSTVSVANQSWNGAVPAGGSVQVGFNGTHTGTNPAPTAFTLNGAGCTTG